MGFWGFTFNNQAFRQPWISKVVRGTLKFSSQKLQIIINGPRARHYFSNAYAFDSKVKSTFERLLRRYQTVFTNKQLTIKSKRATKETTYLLQKQHGVFQIVNSCSPYHHKITSAMIKENQAAIAERFDDQDLRILLLSIFPGNNLFLHKVFAKRARSDLGLDEENIRSFSAATLKKMLSKLYDDREEPFMFPLTSNDKGETPFDLCLAAGNVKSADILLRYLKLQPAGYHSEYVILSLDKLIAAELPSLPSYLDSRVTQTSVQKKLTTMQGFEAVDGKDYMLESSHLHPDYEQFYKQFRHKRTRIFCGREVPIEEQDLLTEKEVKVEVLDLPFVHSYNGEGFKMANKMFEQLADTKNLALFQSRAVQYLVDFNWQQTKMYTIIFLFIPFLFFLGNFIAYSNVYNGQFDNPDDSFEIGYICLSALLYFFWDTLGTERINDSKSWLSITAGVPCYIQHLKNANGDGEIFAMLTWKCLEGESSKSPQISIHKNLEIDAQRITPPCWQRFPQYHTELLHQFKCVFFFSLYFLLNEVGQIMLVRGSYFGWGFIWNAIDVFPPIFIIAVVTARLRQDYEFDELMKPGFIDTVHAVTCILMWLKLLYFLRLFDSTSHLVRVIFNMVWEMKAFLGILCVIYMAFGEAFLRLAEKSPVPEGGSVFLSDFADAFIYTVRLGMGDTDVAALYGLNQPITAWILFVIFELLTCVLMMSLMVALIMRQYARISKDAELNNYQQKAKLIFENSYLTQMFRCCKCTVNYELQRNLMIITDQTSQGLTRASNKDAMQEVQEAVRMLVRENFALKRMLKKQASETDKKIDTIMKAVAK